MGYGVFQPRNEKSTEAACPFFSQNIPYGVPYGNFQPRNEKTRKQIIRFSVKTYHREYPMVIFNPDMKKLGSRLSVFQSKHTIGSTLWSFSTQKGKNPEIDCPFFS